MGNKEEIPKKQLQSRIAEEELRNLDIKTVKDIQDQFGISYEQLSKLSRKEVEILAEDANAIKKQIEIRKKSQISEEQKKEQRIAVKDMYEKLLKDAEASGDKEKIKVYGDALKRIEKNRE